MRIAVADDDPEVRQFITSALSEAGYSCVTMSNGREVVSELRRDTFDLLLLDWNMPGMTGLEVIQWSQENLDPVPPAIVLTSRTDKADIVHALEAGADDFIVKPESADVIVARVGAALRRSRLRRGPDFIETHGPYKFDKLAVSVRVDDAEISLTAKEFALAQLFFRNINRPLSRGYIMQRIWGSVVDLPTRTLDMHVSRLRSKLELRPERGYGLQTVFGYGYRLDGLEAGEKQNE